MLVRRTSYAMTPAGVVTEFDLRRDVLQAAEEGIAVTGEAGVSRLAGKRCIGNVADGVLQRRRIVSFADDGGHTDTRHLYSSDECANGEARAAGGRRGHGEVDGFQFTVGSGLLIRRNGVLEQIPAKKNCGEREENPLEDRKGPARGGRSTADHVRLTRRRYSPIRAWTFSERPSGPCTSTRIARYPGASCEGL